MPISFVSSGVMLRANPGNTTWRGVACLGTYMMCGSIRLNSRPEPGNEARYSSLDSRPEPGNEARYSSLDSRSDNACFHVCCMVNHSQLPTHLVFHKVQRSPPDDTRTNTPIHLAANHSNIQSLSPLLQLRAGTRSKTSLEQIPDTTLLLKV